MRGGAMTSLGHTSSPGRDGADKASAAAASTTALRAHGRLALGPVSPVNGARDGPLAARVMVVLIGSA
jgi:hypothetical protein